ncbi:beta-galactosidase precursor-like protein [Leptotrombidium deliense]|uniref:Beta-galactosidase-like protein n=1 Tax=Leptotrombidium deliense TaxID=299467 RepID=A0A443RYC2_9ACAR|nr:beta-galactosidase precursor-like protein [Leptotrombidium deliense]
MLFAVIVLIFLVSVMNQSGIHAKSFSIDYTNDCFSKDGECFRYVSGTMHYFRVLPEYWFDRLTKLRAAGLNAVQTYVEWNSHEPEPGKYMFSGINDVVKYIETAKKVGLLVILRIGPYIDAERDMVNISDK